MYNCKDPLCVHCKQALSEKSSERESQSKNFRTVGQSSREGNQSGIPKTVERNSEENRRGLRMTVRGHPIEEIISAIADRKNCIETCTKLKKDVHFQIKTLIDVLRERELDLCNQIEKHFCEEMLHVDRALTNKCVEIMAKGSVECRKISSRKIPVFDSNFYAMLKCLKCFGKLKYIDAPNNKTTNEGYLNMENRSALAEFDTVKTEYDPLYWDNPSVADSKAVCSKEECSELKNQPVQSKMVEKSGELLDPLARAKKTEECSELKDQPVQSKMVDRSSELIKILALVERTEKSDELLDPLARAKKTEESGELKNQPEQSKRTKNWKDLKEMVDQRKECKEKFEIIKERTKCRKDMLIQDKLEKKFREWDEARRNRKPETISFFKIGNEFEAAQKVKTPEKDVIEFGLSSKSSETYSLSSEEVEKDSSLENVFEAVQNLEKKVVMECESSSISSETDSLSSEEVEKDSSLEEDDIEIISRSEAESIPPELLTSPPLPPKKLFKLSRKRIAFTPLSFGKKDANSSLSSENSAQSASSGIGESKSNESSMCGAMSSGSNAEKKENPSFNEKSGLESSSNCFNASMDEGYYLDPSVALRCSLTKYLKKNSVSEWLAPRKSSEQSLPSGNGCIVKNIPIPVQDSDQHSFESALRPLEPLLPAKKMPRQRTENDWLGSKDSMESAWYAKGCRPSSNSDRILSALGWLSPEKSTKPWPTGKVSDIPIPTDPIRFWERH